MVKAYKNTKISIHYLYRDLFFCNADLLYKKRLLKTWWKNTWKKWKIANRIVKNSVEIVKNVKQFNFLLTEFSTLQAINIHSDIFLTK